MRLWEVNHPYYMSEGCYFDRNCHQEYDSWQEFLDEWQDSDPDYNCVFRWDWREGDGWEIPPGECHLMVYFILQRKAYPVSARVKVTRDDEPAIREWLTGKWEYIKLLWEPLST